MATGRWRAGFCLGLIIALTGLLAAAAEAATSSWEFDRAEFYFEAAPYGSGPTEPHVFTLTNTGETQLIAKTWGFSWSAVAAWLQEGPRFQVISTQCQNRVLEPGESCSVEVAFDPLHAGWANATLRYKTANEEVPYASVALRGEGTGPAMPMMPSHLDFGSVPVGTTSAPQTVTLENQSTLDIWTLWGTSLTSWNSALPQSGPFKIVGGSCQMGGGLAPGETCSVEVSFAPTETGNFQSSLDVSDAAPESPQSAELEGVAIPAPSVSPEPAPPGTTTLSKTRTAPATTSSSQSKRSCPKGKRKVLRKGKKVCVKASRHQRLPRKPLSAW